MFGWEGVCEFVSVAEQGGFTPAARKLGVSVAQVSRQVAQLEDRLQAKLLLRTTRQVRLTELGEIYFRHCRQLLDNLYEAELALGRHQAVPQGSLRITAPVSYGESRIAPLVNDFMVRFPQLEVTLNLTNQLLDLVHEGFDLAIRLGHLKDSTLVARKLGQTRMLLCAAPAYLARKGTPRTPADLATHDWLSGDMLGSGLLLLDERGGEHRVRFKPRVLCNNVLPLRQFALAGQGISLQPEGEVAEDLAQGRLLALLPGFRVPPMEIHAITPQREIPEKVRRVISALRSHFAEHGQSRLP